MVNETSDRPRLTAKGARTRARIVEEAAALIHERGVAGTTLEDVKVAADVSGSQMYHYFPDKDELVQAVIDYQADTIVTHQRHVLSSANGIEAWRNMVITAAKLTKAKGGCPLIEPCRDERSGLGVTLGELAAERAKRAAPLCFGELRCGDHHVPPGFDSVRAAEHVPLVLDDGVGLVVDDRLHEFVLVGEVVVHLRAADFRRHLDVFQGGARHPALMDEGGGLLHYSGPGARSLGGEPRPAARLVDHAPMLAEF